MKLVNFKSRLLYDLFVVALLVVGLGYVFSRFVHTGGEWTDNATVRQHITPVNSRVPGFIREIRFDEYQRVHKGDTLVIIEDAEFRLAVAQAEAGLANAMAGQKATSAGIATTSNAVKINEATITEVRVNMENAARDLARFERLLQEDAVTRQQYDNMKTAYESAKARYDQVTSAKAGTQLTVCELGHRLNQSEAGIRLAEAQLEMAKLSLSYTVILATADGIVGAKDIHVGQLVNPGQTMVEIVDDSEKWVIANYRETQLPNIALGAEVEITADAVPGVTYHGHVERMADATGSAFSMIPTDNATGNFVKIEQRVPVRISLEGNDAELLDKLRAGYNLEVTVKKIL